MSANAVLADCLRRSQHGPDQLDAIRDMANGAAEPSVHRYLDEAMCCFAVGSYRAAYVLGWCAIAEHFRLILDAVREIASVVYIGKYKREGPGAWDGKSLIKVVEELDVFDSPAAWPDGFAATFAKLSDKRDKLAHPSTEPVKPEDVLSLVKTGRSVFATRVVDARVGTIDPVRKALTRPGITPDVRKRVVNALSADALVEFAKDVLQRLFLDEDMDDPGKAKIWLLWKTAVASPELSADGKSRLMARLNELLEPLRDDQAIIDPQIDIRLGARATEVGDGLVIWESVEPEHTRIWTYFVEAVDGDRPRQITHGIKEKYLARAPVDFRKRMIDVWARLEGSYGR